MQLPSLMLPIVVIVGRPNVGKSTLFNRLTRSRDAIVADVAGLTRDRHYGRGSVGDRPYLVVDTGGFEPAASEGIFHEMARQARQALDEADSVLFVVDARAGLTGQDQAIASELRRTGRPLFLVVNKAEGMDPAVVKTLHDAFRRSLDDPKVLALFDRFDQPVIYMNSEEYTRFALRSIEAERAIIDKLGLKASM